MFNEEDENKFKERVEMAKLRKETADDNMRFIKYLLKMDNELVSDI